MKGIYIFTPKGFRPTPRVENNKKAIMNEGPFNSQKEIMTDFFLLIKVKVKSKPCANVFIDLNCFQMSDVPIGLLFRLTGRGSVSSLVNVHLF